MSIEQRLTTAGAFPGCRISPRWARTEIIVGDTPRRATYSVNADVPVEEILAERLSEVRIIR